MRIKLDETFRFESDNAKMDSQTVEILGRNRLIEQLVLAGLEVALPLRDRGIDIIAYMDLTDQTSKFVAVPIQLKAASIRSFSIDKKYNKISNLVIAYVWGVQEPDDACTYALTYDETLGVAEKMGWTKTATWINKGVYSNTRPGKDLRDLLEGFLMSPEVWHNKVVAISQRVNENSV